jgi:hypothetical protein
MYLTGRARSESSGLVSSPDLCERTRRASGFKGDGCEGEGDCTVAKMRCVRSAAADADD